MHVGALCLFLAIDPRGVTVDVAGGVTAELRGGRAPVVIDAEPEPAMLMVLIPNADLRIRMRRRGAIFFGYAPRFVLRVPNMLGLDRPLVLHQLSLLYDVALSRRWDFSGVVTSSVGELDYTANNLVLGTMQGSAPSAAVLQYAVVEASTTFTVRATSIDTVYFGPAFAYRTPVGEELQLDETPTLEQLAMILPEQLSGSVFAAYTRMVSPVDDLSLQITPGVMSFSPGALFATVDARLAWSRQLQRRLRSRIDGGVFTAHVLERRDDPFGARSRVLPIGNAGLTGQLLSRATVRLEADASVGVNGFFDVLRGTVQPRAGGTLQLAADIPPRWRVGLMTSFFTSANREPQTVIDGPQPLLDETVLYAQTPVTYMIDERMFLEFGTIVTARGPHLDVDDFSFGQLELWGYVAFRFSVGTARGGREVESRGGSIGGLGPASGVAGAAIGAQRRPPPGAPAVRGGAGVAAPTVAPDGPSVTPGQGVIPHAPLAPDEAAVESESPVGPPGTLQEGEVDEAPDQGGPEKDAEPRPSHRGRVDEGGGRGARRETSGAPRGGPDSEPE
jgi:hypothetical protein